MKRAILPAAFILDLDDVMWHDGRDLRRIGQASRTEFPRTHVKEDYLVIEELGRALNMKIICPICLGDWDKDNYLRGVVGLTHNPHGWNRKEEIDMKLAEEYFNAAESSEHIDYAVHALLHGLYDENGKHLNELQYFYKDADGVAHLLPNEQLDLQLDLFFKIYNSWGFKKDIVTFCPPCGIPLRDYNDWASIDRLSSLLYKRGVRYIIARWQKGREYSCINSGVLYIEKNALCGAPSSVYDVNPDYVADFGKDGDESFGDVFGMHWNNFLHYYPADSFKRIPQWVEWFKRQSEVFGLMLSRDMRFTGNQCIYRKNSVVTVDGDKCTVDVSGALALGFDDLGNEFYISFKNDSLPKSCTGGKMELYEEKKNFKTYKIICESAKIEFQL